MQNEDKMKAVGQPIIGKELKKNKTFKTKYKKRIEIKLYESSSI